MDRDTIYSIIDGERTYQDFKWSHVDANNNSSIKFNSVGDFITYMTYYMQKIQEAYTTNSGNVAALEQMRKLVALGVACFEQHGVPERIIKI